LATYRIAAAWPAWTVAAAAMAMMLGCAPSEAAEGRGGSQRQEQASEEPATPALADIDGVERAFVDDDSKATVIVFTLHDCPIANAYVPTLNTLLEEYEPQGVRMLLVHVDPKLTNAAARKHAEEYQIKAPIVIDREHAWVARAGATKSPEAAVFSPSGDLLYLGRIDDRYAGLGRRRMHLSSHDLRDALDAIVAGRTVSNAKTEVIGCPIPELPQGE
jgi:hypothetical protein